METTIMLRLYWRCIGIMENKMGTTIMLGVAGSEALRPQIGS